MTSPLTPNAQTADAALFDPTRSWVVTAGAGTGKTWRLVRRYVRCLEHLHSQRLSAHSMLAVTFTRAAAAEMRQRVLQALLRSENPDPAIDPVLAAVQGWPTAMRETLAAQVAEAPIETIHSFCARLLAALPEVSGVAPGVRPIEPSQDELRRDQFVRHFVDGVLDGTANADQDDATALLTEYSLGELRTMLSDAIGASDSPKQELTTAAGVAAAREALWRPQLQAWGDKAGPLLEEACQQLEQAPTGAIGERMGQVGALRKALNAKEYLDAWNIRAGLNFNYRKANKDRDGSAFAAFESAWLALNDDAQFRLESTLVRMDRATEMAHCERLARVMRLGLAARQAYAATLADEGLMRFDDLEYRCLAMLDHPEAQSWLAGRYRHIMVDEFQDTSPRQLDLVQKLHKACAQGGAPVSLFEVGDVKQSIYRFRGAEVGLFQSVLAAAPPEQRGHLAVTHRTRPELAAVFNQVFPHLLGGIAGEVADGAEVPWNPEDTIQTSKPQSVLPGKPLTLLLALPEGEPEAPPEEESDEGEDSEDEFSPTEPARVAKWLKDYAASARDLKWSDVAILLPKWNAAEEFRAALEAAGIRAHVGGGRGLKRIPAVRDLWNLLAYLCDATDDIAAAGVLRGPCFGLSDLGLLVLAKWPGVKLPWTERDLTVPRRHARSLHAVARLADLDAAQAVAALVAAGAADPEQQPQLVAQLEADARSLKAGKAILDDLLQRAGSVPTADLLTEAVERLQLARVWTAERDPERASANAWRFIELVRSLEPEGPDLSSLSAWLQGDADPSPEGLIAGEQNAVTITTCHGAKGLEWRVVILANLEAGLQQGSKDLLKLGPVARWPSAEMPLGPLRRDVVAPRLNGVPDQGLRYDSDPVQRLESVLNSGLNAAEVKRLLYVAMTRAGERLVLSGTFAQEGSQSVLASEDRTKGYQAAGIPFEGSWRPLIDCKRASHYVTSVLRLRPDQEQQTWALAGAAGEHPLSDFVEIVDIAKLSRATEAAATLPELPPLPELPAVGTVPLTTEWRPATPSTLQSSFWPHGKLGQNDAPLKIAIPANADELGSRSERKAQYGSLLHAAFELWGMVPSQKPDEAALRQLAQALLPSTAAQDDLGWLQSCLDALENSELGREMAAAAARGELLHELPFDARVNANDTPLTLSGRIDALFRDAGGHWVVIDYKLTQKGPLQYRNELQGSYAKQLLAYQAALSACGIGPLGRAGLWLAASGEVVWLLG